MNRSNHPWLRLLKLTPEQRQARLDWLARSYAKERELMEIAGTVQGTRDSRARTADIDPLDPIED